MDRRGVGRGLLLPLVGVWLLAGFCVAVAGTSGKISGRVIDKNKQPMVGVNVAVPAAHTGAITDADGRYQVLNIPAGSYEVKFALIGFQAVTVQGVVISADETTRLDQTMTEAPVQIEEMVVSAKRPVVDVTLTSSKAIVDREEIQKLPVQELKDIVTLQAGVIQSGGDLHFRGGRVGEVQFQMDGVSVNNPYTNQSTLNIDRSLLEEVQVISGTFDAEYGQAMSGVVNAVLRRGTDQFRWNAEILGGLWAYDGARRYTSPCVPFLGACDGVTPWEYHPEAQQNYQVSASGPVGLPKTYFLVNARRYHFDDYITAEKRFTPVMGQVPDSIQNPPPPWIWKAVFPDGDGSQEALAYTHEWSGLAKISNRSLKNIEISYQAVLDNLDARKNVWAYRFDPDGLSRQRTRSLVHGVDFTHTLSPKMYYELSVRQNLLDYRDMVYDDVYDPRYDAAGQAQGYSGYEYGAYTQGVSLDRFTQKTNAWLLKSTVTSQWRRDEQMKVGAEFQWPFLEFGVPGHLVAVTDPITHQETLVRYIDKPPDYPAVTKYQPFIVGAYAQNQTEWSDLRLRLGVRFDYFNPRATIPSDLANPANSIDSVPLSHPVAASRKISISPRIGVSYPITQGSALFFAYGHFYQMPPITDMFRDADYNLLTDLQAGTASYRVIGNPDAGPERTVQYQFGYRQAVTGTLGLEASMFYKDIRDLLGVEFIDTYNGATYARATNIDFGSVVGFTVSLDQRQVGMWSTTIDYTWQRAQGNSSDPRETATRASNGEDPRPRVVPFSWDQRHTLNTTITFTHPWGLNASAVIRLASGQPYTPVTEGTISDLETNSGRKPISTLTDLRGEKLLSFGSVKGSLFARVFNLFDTRFWNGFVFPTSGSPYYSRFSSEDATANDPTRYYAPRRIELGLSLGGGE